MYYGRYFRLDTDVANIEKGVAVFRYCPDGKTNCGVYATFSDDEIVFHFNARVDDTINNATILHIPMDDNIEHSFADTVTKAFHSKIDIGDVTAQPQENPHLSYYSTFPFATNSKSAKNGKKRRSMRKMDITSPASDQFPVRKLILDFLFDLKETRIFEMSPHYRDLTEKLRDNFFARCLIAKARYKYQRAFYEGTVKESRLTSSTHERKTRKNKRQFYGELLFQAEKEWADCIRDPRSDQTFHDEYHGWFDDSETEMRSIYLPHLPIALNDGVTRKLKNDHDKNTSSWFVTRHAALTAWRILFVGNSSFFGIHLIRPRVLLAVGVGWLTIGGIGHLSSSANNMSPPSTRHAILLAVTIIAVSWLLIWRVAPRVKNIPFRALRFSCYVLLTSCVVGCVLSPMIGAETTFSNICLAAFIGLIVHVFLQGGDPNEPV